MGTTFGLHHILFPHPGLYPLSTPPHAGVKVEFQSKPKWPPPILGSGSPNMLEFFDFEKIFFACGTLKFFLGYKRWERRFFFLEKSHMFFLGHAPRKKGWGIHFWRNFSILRNYFFRKKFGGERRERRKEGTTERGNDWNDTTSALFKNLVDPPKMTPLPYPVG